MNNMKKELRGLGEGFKVKIHQVSLRVGALKKIPNLKMLGT